MDHVGSRLPAPFFVMGCQRTGTTLLNLLLDSHPRIAVFIGTHYYIHLARHRECYGDLRKLSNLKYFVNDVRRVVRMHGEDAPATRDVLAILPTPSFEDVLTAFLYLYARDRGKELYGDKTPEHYLYLNSILEAFPESPVIFTIRDPRDTVLSIRKGMGTSLDGAIRAWNTAFRKYQDAIRPVHLIRYEDLVQQPVESLERLCGVLGTEFDEAMMQFFERTPTRYRARSHHSKLFRPIDTQSLKKYRQMSSYEIRRIEAACMAGMEALGYECEESRSTPVRSEVPERGKWYNTVVDRLGYYRFHGERWARGVVHWRIVWMARFRHIVLGVILRRL